MIALLNETETICRRYQFDSFLQQIFSARQLVSNKSIEISVYGQFKAGKSSFINNIVGEKILPVGVTPVTSVITHACYGPKENVQIIFEDGHSREIPLSDIGEYITEKLNPDNVKGIKSARVELPVLEKLKGLCLVDTPGIGSIFINNSKTSNDNIVFSSIAIVCVSAERPLAETDLELINNLIRESYSVTCLLTKVDLFTEKQTEELMAYIINFLQQKTGHNIPVYKYSVYQDNDIYRNKIYNELLLPYIKNIDFETEQIARHKILNLANSCLEYLDLAIKASRLADKERANLKAKIFDEKLNLSFIRHELTLIASDSKSRVRDSVFNLIEPYIQDIIFSLEKQFDQEFTSWKGNLYRLTRTYEDWLRTVIGIKLLEIIDKEKSSLEKILTEVNSKFSFYTETFKGSIERRVYQVLKLKISTQIWQPSFKAMKKPDISVYPAFDTPIDLIWFLFPMFVFRNVFRRYYRQQIKKEVLKNIHRTISKISDIIFKEVDLNKTQILDYIFNEIQTIEHALDVKNSKTKEYMEDHKRLKNIISKISE